MLRTALTLTLAAGTLALSSAAPALADTPTPAPGPVVVLGFDLMPLTVYPDAHGCIALPPGAHMIANMSDKPVTTFITPDCLIPAPPPFTTIAPGYGGHVSPYAGSFEAG